MDADNIPADTLRSVRDFMAYGYESAAKALLDSFDEYDASERKSVLTVVEFFENEAERIRNESE